MRLSPPYIAQLNVMKKHILSLIIIILGFSSAFSAEEYDSTHVYFRQSRIEIIPDFMDNGVRLDSLSQKLEALSPQDSLYRLKHIHVIGAASPEGSVKFNSWLSKKRAYAIFDYFNSRRLLPDSALSFSFLGRDWRGLRKAVQSDSAVPFKDDVISLIDQIVGTDSVSYPAIPHPLRRLKNLHDGIPYLYLYKNIFPELRTSKIIMEYEPREILFLLTEPPAINTTETITLIPAPELLPLPSPVIYKVCRPFYMALKTNLLYDALLIPNIGAEFYVGKNWSVLADWQYGWWDTDSRHWYWRAYGGNIGVRKWFGKKASEKPLTGHHLGLYAGIVTYDFEFGGEGVMGGIPGRTLWDRCNYYGGIEYGYSLPVARRLNIDFSIGIGYMGGKYYKYEPQGGVYVWKSTHRLNWIGPTKAEISLVWLLGCDNYNRKKGGQ